MNTLVLHDLPEDIAAEIFADLPEEYLLLDTRGEAAHCIGCFGCWVKTPGHCVMRDYLYDLPDMAARSDTLIIISRCCYGGYSPDIKRALDRIIGYMLPFFEITGGEMHHVRRHENGLKRAVMLMYGADAEQREIAKGLAAANAKNMGISHMETQFFADRADVKGAVACV